MRWINFKLYKLAKKQNSIGQFVSDWSYVQDIGVMISHNLYSNVVNDVVYRDFAYNGVTKFKDFEVSTAYKICNDDNEYRIESFNASGRYSQLLLKDVVMDE